MRVGSIVECINNKGSISTDHIRPQLKVVYTVRDIYMSPSEHVPAIRLEEIINKIHPVWNIERGYRMTRFCELLPPVANIEEHINENTLEPELI